MGGSPQEQDDTVTYRWTASGGSLGNPQAGSTSWTAPTAPGVYVLTVTVDDLAQLPTGDDGSRDDAPQSAQVEVTVMGSAPTWSPGSALSAGLQAPLDGLRVAPGTPVDLVGTEAFDADTRVGPGGVTHPADTVSYQWSVSPAAGSLADPQERVTTWTAPAQPGRYLLRLRVDDAAVLPAGEGGTRKDGPREFTAAVEVGAAFWDPHPPIQGAAILDPPDGLVVEPGASVALAGAEATDLDTRTAASGSETRDADTLRYRWSGPGLSATTREAAWTAPQTPGWYTLRLTVDDLPKSIPSSERGSRDDAAEEREVRVKVRHYHQWHPAPAISPATFTVVPRFVHTGEVVPLSPQENGYDSDRCTRPQCGYAEGFARDAVRTTAWMGPAGGEFGRLDGNGDFVPESDAARVTHWRAPLSLPGRYLDVTLQRETDDDPAVAVDPDPDPDRAPTEPLFPLLVNDPPVRYGQSFRVLAHRHQWEAGDPVAVAPVTVSQYRPLGGETVALHYHGATDADRCAAGSCSFSGGRAPNETRLKRWTATEGDFGYFDAGVFVVSTDPARITHWRAPTLGSPMGGLGGSSRWVTLYAYADDLPQAEDPDRGEPVATFDDDEAAAEVRVRVVRHRHLWEAVHNLSAPTPWVETAEPRAGQVVEVRAGPAGVTYGMDLDACLAPQCPFPGGWVYGSAPVRGWADGNKGGTFGRLVDGVFQPESDPARVTHYRCPATGVPAAGLPVTLTVTVDDTPPAPPMTLDPELQELVETFDDQPATGSVALTVRRHQHQWMQAHTLPAPTLSLGTPSAAAGALVPVSAAVSTPEQDQCLNFFDCPFPGAIAPNAARLKEWSDGGAGGAFGKLVNGQLQPCPPDQVTHYRCPEAGAMVTLRVTAEDVWQGVAEPSGDSTDTFNDDDTEATAALEVRPPHQHQFTSTGNTATQRVVLKVQGQPVTRACIGDALEIDRGSIAPDQDVCTAPECPFPAGVAVEDATRHRIVRFEEDGGGKFGTISADGTEFIEKSNVAEITHYLVGSQTGPVQVWAVIDDAGVAVEPAGRDAATVNDPTKNGEAHALDVVDCPFSAVKSRRALADSDICACTSCRQRAAAFSAIEPGGGTLEFEVPVTGWTYRGISLGLALHYDTNARPDPGMASPESPDLQPTADLAHMSQWNSRWTHTWAQFVEVVDDGSGEAHAVWHTGDGGVRSFLAVGGQPGQGWTSGESFLSLNSGGTATTTVRARPAGGGCGGARAQNFRQHSVVVPYGWFEARDASGTTYRFDRVHWAKGLGVAVPYFLLTRMTDRWGRAVSLQWDGDRLLAVSDGAGHGLTFTYADRLLRAITDTHGRTHTLTYAAVPRPDGGTRQKLTGVTVQGPGSPHRADYLWQFDYGTAAAGGAYGGTYTGDLVIRKREPSGRWIHYTYAPAGGDGDGRVVSASYADPAEGNRVKTITRTGTTVTYPGGDSYTYEYQGSDLAAVRHNATGREVRYTYDALHNLTTVRGSWQPAGAPALVSLHYTFAADGRTIVKTRATDALGRVSETDFGPFHLPTESRAWDSLGGQRVSRFLYNAVGNLVQATAAWGTPLALSTTLAYGSSAAPDLPTAITDALGRTDSTTYDALGRPVRSTSPPNLVTDPDDPDHDPSVTVLEWTADGLPAAATDPLGRRVTLAYNGLGGSRLEVTARAVADGSSTVTVLDAEGQVLWAVDQEGRRTEFTYNGDGQVLSVTEAAGTPAARVTRYEYDLHGDLVRLVPPRGELGAVRFDYRRYGQFGGLEGPYEGQVTRIQHPDGTEEYFGYDAAGERAWHSRPSPAAGGGVQWSVTTWEYDALGRPTRVTVPPSPQGVPGFTGETEYDDWDRVRRVTDATGTTTWTYDVLDRVVQVSPSGGRRGLTAEYLPDLVNRRWRTRTTLAGVGTWEEREDTKGRFSGVVNPFGQAFQVEYDPAGQPRRRLLANGARTEYEYTPRGFLHRLTHRLANGSLLDRFTYQHDRTGRLLAETDLGGRVHAFQYDPLGQLTDEQHPDLGPGGVQYEYDANGNRRRVVRNGASEWYGVDAADRLLWTNTAGDAPPQPGQAADYSLFTYDAFGQTVRRDRRAGGVRHALDFLWDGDGRLREVREAGASLFSALYEAGGERVSRTDPAGTQVDSFGLHESGTGETVHTPGLAQRKNGVDRFFHEDWLGSTRYLTDATASTAPFAARYDGYGRRTALGGTDGGHPTEYQFAGAWGYRREAADGIGLDLLGHRWYDPLAGRFLTRDPIRWEGGLNLYGYAGNDPVNAVDPDGLAYGPLTDLERRGVESNVSMAGKWLGDRFNDLNEWAETDEGRHYLYLAIAALSYPGAGARAGVRRTGPLGTATVQKALPPGPTLKALPPQAGVTWNNGYRASNGKFGMPCGTGRPGAAAVERAKKELQARGWEILATEVTVRDATGQVRRYDIAARTPHSIDVAVEVKSGKARLRGRQLAFDRRLNSTGQQTLRVLGSKASQVPEIRRAIVMRR